MLPNWLKPAMLIVTLALVMFMIDPFKKKAVAPVIQNNTCFIDTTIIIDQLMLKNPGMNRHQVRMQVEQQFNSFARQLITQ